VIAAALLAVGAFVAMEGVSYAAHRWLMHGPGMGWHRSHHVPAAGRFERNDLFPVCFSVVGVLLFALASFGPRIQPLFWVGAGVTAYGALYLVVHEVCIHRRLPVPVPDGRYASFLRDAHRVHHATGGEPYGMLLPFVSRASVDAAARREREPLARDARRPSTRSARSRL
jgi:beta-carotene 3-hydroxylase